VNTEGEVSVFFSTRDAQVFPILTMEMHRCMKETTCTLPYKLG